MGAIGLCHSASQPERGKSAFRSSKILGHKSRPLKLRSERVTSLPRTDMVRGFLCGRDFYPFDPDSSTVSGSGARIPSCS